MSLPFFCWFLSGHFYLFIWLTYQRGNKDHKNSSNATYRKESKFDKASYLVILFPQTCRLLVVLKWATGTSVVKTSLLMQKVRVRSLLRELRSWKLCSQKQNRSQVYWEALLFQIFHYSGKHSFKMFLMNLHSGRSPSLVIIIGWSGLAGCIEPAEVN